jgi:hypothetical protein
MGREGILVQGAQKLVERLITHDDFLLSRVTVYMDEGIRVHVIPPGTVCWAGGKKKENGLENNEMAGDRFKMERKSFSAEAKCIINSLIETDTSNGSPTQM